jgi:NADH dehydrogenase [ubiquinone] 1 alpha subcomplex assembly factor 1
MRHAAEYLEKGGSRPSCNLRRSHPPRRRRALTARRRRPPAAVHPWPERQRLLCRFDRPQDLALWTTFADADLGGASTAELAPSSEFPAAAELRGALSRAVPPGAAVRLKRAGFAGATLRRADDDPWDLDDFHSLVFRVRGDGRVYLANLRTDNWVVGDQAGQDVWQAFLFAPKDEWAEVEVPFDRFRLTWRGGFVEDAVEMRAGRVTSLGLSLAGGAALQPEGPYRLAIEWVAARNRAVVIEREEEWRRGGGGGGAGRAAGGEDKRGDDGARRGDDGGAAPGGGGGGWLGSGGGISGGGGGRAA